MQTHVMEERMTGVVVAAAVVVAVRTSPGFEGRRGLAGGLIGVVAGLCSIVGRSGGREGPGV